MQKAIGIDPDASGFVFALVGGQAERPVTKRFSVGAEDLEKFIRWLTAESPSIVAIEGIEGQSGPIEKALREAGMVFYSFTPADTDKYRKAVLGENKNNERDAEGVARFALSMREQGNWSSGGGCGRRTWICECSRVGMRARGNS